MRRAAKQDANQGEIDEALEALGWGARLPQLLHCDRIALKAGRIVLLEVKDGTKKPSARRLTPAEVKCQAWCRRYGVEVLLIESVEDLRQLDQDARRAIEGHSGLSYDDRMVAAPGRHER
jgi:hypothetical protein